MELDDADFAAIVAETSARARDEARTFDHPYELQRRIDALLDDAAANSHTYSIESHPEQTTRNRAGQIARRLALNPAEQRRLNRDLLALITALEQRTRRQEVELSRLRSEVMRLTARLDAPSTP